MKISEAKEKVCPYITLMQHSKKVVTSELQGEQVLIENSLCITGDCMAWEYTKKDKRKIFKTTFTTPKGWEFVEYDTNNNMVCVQDIEEDEKEGYCKRLK